MKHFATYCLCLLLAAVTFAVTVEVGAIIFDATLAHAQAADAGIDAGSALGSAAAVAPTAPPLHDPTQNPMAFLSDVEALKKYGWAAVVTAIAIGLLELAQWAGKSITALAFLSKGRTTVLLGGALGIGTAALAALLGAGSWAAVALAAMTALSVLWQPGKAAA